MTSRIIVIIISIAILFVLLPLADAIVQLFDFLEEGVGSLGYVRAPVDLELDILLPGVVLRHAGHGVLLQDRDLLRVHLVAVGRDLLADALAQVDNLVHLKAGVGAADQQLGVELLDVHLVGLQELAHLVDLRLEVHGQLDECAVVARDDWVFLVEVGVAMSDIVLRALLVPSLSGGGGGLRRSRNARHHDEGVDLEGLALDWSRLRGVAEVVDGHGGELERRASYEGLLTPLPASLIASAMMMADADS
ncbi:hypothetical protein PG994_008878 [Apiospora phragmitis]|uniref:Secreted protein n=1 Tax=Apiospora phragmitis TaxID=2905665 RepID=A0ABR1UK44_9PEZI